MSTDSASGGVPSGPKEPLPAPTAVVRVREAQSGDAWNETELPESASSRSADTADSFMRAVGAIGPTHKWLPELEPERVGQRVGPYEIKGRIGEGGMGIVYAADDTRLRRRVALKVLPAALMRSDDRRRRFLREARSASAVHHTNVATVFDVGESQGTVYLAMELVNGRTLRAHLKEHGVLPLSAAIDIGLQAARGLARAHAAGVIHRDVKPENIMIDPEGVVKLLDFGLAKLASTADAPGSLDESPAPVDELASHVGTVLGTPAYMSPEQAAGVPVDVRTDVYSMGIVLFEMLTGARPKAGAIQGPLVPAPIAGVIANCLRPAPADRYQDAEKLAQALFGLTVPKVARTGWRLPLAAAAAASAAGLTVWLTTLDGPKVAVEAAPTAASAFVAALSGAPPATTPTAPSASPSVSSQPAASSAVPSASLHPTAREKPHARRKGLSGPMEHQK